MENDLPQSLDLYEAADYLKMHWQTLRAKAKAGEVPAAKLAKRWVFLQDDLASYLRSHYSVARPRLHAQQTVGVTLCCSSDLTRVTGGAALPHQTEAEYKSLLKR